MRQGACVNIKWFKLGMHLFSYEYPHNEVEDHYMMMAIIMMKTLIIMRSTALKCNAASALLVHYAACSKCCIFNCFGWQQLSITDLIFLL